MKKEAGFTLIEIIVSLILIGIMASVAGMGIVTGVRGYLFARDNAAISEKAQLAMSRMNRTFMEVLDVTTAQASRVTYNRLSGGANIQETLYLDAGDHRIKIAAGGNASGGDPLADNVSGLTLTYRKGAGTWAQGTDDFTLLSGIAVNLVMTRPEGGTNVAFATVVSPRNNGNRGGSASTTVPNPATGCFVATAAFGQPDHPLVLVLKEFRDRYLLTWPGGRMLVQMYWAGGPPLADWIREKAWACTLTQALLMPIAGMAFLILQAPLAVPLLLLLGWAGAVFFSKRIRIRRKTVPFHPAGQKGSILLGLIITMVVFSFLGAAILSLTTSSTFSQIGSTSATRAYYLAEAGMRYAASEFRNAGSEDAKDNILESLNNHDFTMSGNDGKFHLDVYPHYFKTTAIPTGNTLQAKFPGGVPAGMSIPSSGYLKIGNSTPRQYTGFALAGSTINFTMAATLTGFSTQVNSVLPVGVASGQNLSKDGNLALSSGAGSFPLLNGTFTIGTAHTVYTYKARSGNTLQGVTLSLTPAQAFTVTVPANADVTLLKFVNLRSRGIFAQGGPFEANRTVSYSIPIGWVQGAGTGKAAYTEPFADLSHWFTGSGGGELGTHAVATAGGSPALRVTDTYSPPWDIFSLYQRKSFIAFNWGSAGTDLNQSWSISDHLLSYDTQVKVRANGQNYYMAGPVFRVDTSGRMYGVSYLRADTGTGFLGIDDDRVPNDLCPLDATPMIVLWQETPANTFKWLAYKILTTADGVIDNNGRHLADWSTLVVRVIEADALSFDQGGPGTTGTLRHGDLVTGATSGATATVDGTPILTSGGWGTSNAAGWLTVTNVTKAGGAIQFQSGESLTVEGVVRARYTGTSRQKDNYIRVYYGSTSASGSAGTSPLDNNRLANARISDPATQQVNWPMDNVADWAAANDAFTLVQWNDALNLDAGDARLGTGSELNAVIRTNALTTPSSGSFTQPEVGLITWGSNSTSVYFDDFALQTAAPGQTQGFLPAIQQ